MSEQSPEFRLPLVSGLIFLCVRGALLWLVVPLGFLTWLIGWPLWHQRGVGLGKLLGWADLNLAAAIQRSILRPLVRYPLRWTPLVELPSVTHRIRFTDLLDLP
jgi:hypothetical protein